MPHVLHTQIGSFQEISVTFKKNPLILYAHLQKMSNFTDFPNLTQSTYILRLPVGTFDFDLHTC